MLEVYDLKVRVKDPTPGTTSQPVPSTSC